MIQEMSVVRGYKNMYIGDFRCGLFVPPLYDNTKKYPLIIRLHGYTDTTSWNLIWYNKPIVTDDPCIVLTPKCSKEEIYGWGDSFNPGTSPMMAKTNEMIALVEKAFNIDEDRNYIYGISMGGAGIYGAIQKDPYKYAAAYVECGNVNVDIAPIIAGIPIWIFHGSDDPVVPVQPARDLYQAVLDFGGTEIRYTEYPGVGHNVWDYTANETTKTSWLLAQRKGSFHAAPENVKDFGGELISGNKVNFHWALLPESGQTADNKIWYCKIYRDNEVIKEIFNNHNSYIDSLGAVNSTFKYSISAVNYYFIESEPSQSLSFAFGK